MKIGFLVSPHPPASVASQNMSQGYYYVKITIRIRLHTGKAQEIASSRNRCHVGIDITSTSTSFDSMREVLSQSWNPRDQAPSPIEYKARTIDCTSDQKRVLAVRSQNHPGIGITSIATSLDWMREVLSQGWNPLNQAPSSIKNEERTHDSKSCQKQTLAVLGRTNYPWIDIT